MARTVRKEPQRRDRRTAERAIDFAPGPWFIPADPSNVTPMRRRYAGDDAPLTPPMQARFARLGGF